jgi:glycosyltransferase involved in cell wall biosynthesis
VILTYIHSGNPEDELQVRLRCRNFSDAINRVGWHSANLLDLDAFLQNTPEAHKVCAASDLLIIHRYLYGPVLPVIEYWKARDKKVIVDFDQAIDHLTPDISNYSFWLECASTGNRATGFRENTFTSTPLEQFKWGLGIIDAAIVSSTRLMVDWSQYTDVHEIPDYLNTDQYPGSKQVHENEVWIGMANNVRSASIKDSGLLSALQNVCRKRPQVKLVTNGECRLPGIRDSQQVSYPHNSFEEWAEILLKLDIGLLPIYGDYDLRSGRIGLLEFMVSKIPWLASNQPPLRELAHYGGLVQNTSNAWESAILRAVDNIGVLQKRAAAEPFLFALSQDVNQNIDKVLKLFTYILNQTKRSGAG